MKNYLKIVFGFIQQQIEKETNKIYNSIPKRGERFISDCIRLLWHMYVYCVCVLYNMKC